MAAETIQNRILYGLGESCWLLADLAAAQDLTHSQFGQAAALLICRGLVERVEIGCFRLTDAGRAAIADGVRIESGVTGPDRALRIPPRKSIRQRAWNVMRIQKVFTVPDLATAVQMSGDGDVVENLRRYCSELARAGYLLRSARRQPGTAPGSNGFAVYTLIRNTGRLAPVYSRKTGTIHDFNEVPA